MERKRVNYDDDFVVVINHKTNEEVYRGLEDLEPMKREDWVWSDKTKSYHLGDYEKICYEVSEELLRECVEF